MFGVGDKVICINDSVGADKVEEVKEIYLNWVKRDKEYHVRGVYDNDGIVPGILLEEVHNFPVRIPLTGKIQEPAFATWRFRKAAEQHTTAAAEVEEETLITV
jgi:hypothetical protein